MEKVECSNCKYKLKKPTIESLIYEVKKNRGCVMKDICPNCKQNTLKIN